MKHLTELKRVAENVKDGQFYGRAWQSGHRKSLALLAADDFYFHKQGLYYNWITYPYPIYKEFNQWEALTELFEIDKTTAMTIFLSSTWCQYDIKNTVKIIEEIMDL